MFSIYIWFIELWFHLHNRSSKWYADDSRRENSHLTFLWSVVKRGESKYNTALGVYGGCLSFFSPLSLTQCVHTYCTSTHNKMAKNKGGSVVAFYPPLNKQRTSISFKCQRKQESIDCPCSIKYKRSQTKASDCCSHLAKNNKKSLCFCH